MTTEAKELTHAERNAAGWMATISEYIACKNADRDRLEELRDEREAYEIDEDADASANVAAWESENPDEAAELAELTAAVTVEGEECDEDDIQRRIDESPLSVQVRGGWHTPGEEEDGPEEFEIMLSTGGPALRIIGDLDQYCQPTRCRLEHRDWGTPWTEYFPADHDDLLAFASCFFFGE